MVCPGVAGPNLAAESSRRAAPRRLGRTAGKGRDREADPHRGGARWGPADAAAVLRLAADQVERDRRDRRRARRRRPVPARAGVRAGRGRGRDDRAAAGARATSASCSCPPPRGSDRRRLRGGRPAGARPRAPASSTDRRPAAAAASGGASPLDYAELLVNDLAEAALSLRPEIDAGLTALDEAGAAVTLVDGVGADGVRPVRGHRRGGSGRRRAFRPVTRGRSSPRPGSEGLSERARHPRRTLARAAGDLRRDRWPASWSSIAAPQHRPPERPRRRVGEARSVDVCPGRARRVPRDRRVRRAGPPRARPW